VTSFRGSHCTVSGGKPPHKLGSTGRVYTSDGEYFPSVFNLVWHTPIPDEPRYDYTSLEMRVVLLDMIQLACDATQYCHDNETKASALARIRTAQAVLRKATTNN
jgi:hypothetical protein